MNKLLLLLLPLAFAQVQFNIVIQPDRFPNDISWELFRRDDLARIGRGTRSAGGRLAADEYIFRIRDQGGDGICCANGNGAYALRASNVNFFVSNGQYGAEEIVEFTLNNDGSGTITNGAQPTTPQRTGEYSIELVPAAGFNPNSAPELVAALQASADRWAEVIVGDLPDIAGVDDLRITYDFSPIDGRGRTIGSAGPTRLRRGSLLPYTGQMTFDSADVGSLSTGELEALFLHEMGHVLGVGTIWRNLGCSQCEQGNPRYNPAGRCPNAAQAFRNTPGRGNGVELLIEQDGGQGTACGHFDETQLQSEVMTGFLTVNRQTGISEVSTITIGTLEDMGYEVNYDAADPYTVPTSNLNRANIILDLSGDMLETEMTVDIPDEEMEMEEDNINDMMGDSGSSSGPASNVPVVAGTVGAAAVVGLGAAFFIRRRRKSSRVQQGKKHAVLVEAI